MRKYKLIHPYRHHSYEIVKALISHNKDIEAIYGFYDKYNLSNLFNINKLKGYYDEKITSHVKTFISSNILFILTKLKIISADKYIKYFQRKAIKRINKDDVVIVLQDYCEDIINYCIKNKVDYIYDHIMPCGFEQRKLLIDAAKKNNFSMGYVENYMPVKKIEKNLYYIREAKMVLNASYSTYLIAELALDKIHKEKNKLLIYGSNFKNFQDGYEAKKHIEYRLKDINKRKMRVLAVGSLSLVKGTNLLIEIINKSEGLEVEFGIVGVSNQREDSIFSTWFYKNKNVKYYGHIPHKEIKKIYLQYDILIMTSIIEGFGMVALEAMSSGMPCIVNSNCSNVIENNNIGIVVNNMESKYYIEAINKYIEKDIILEHSINAYEKSCENTWIKYHEKLCKCLNGELK